MTKFCWDEKRDEFKRRYFAYDYRSISDLASSLGLPFATANDWLYKSYKGELPLKRQRDDLEAGIRAEAIKNAINELSATLKKEGRLMAKLLDKIEDNLDNGLYGPKEMVDVFAKLGASLKSVHSTVRLEEGKSTSNVGVASGVMDMSKVKAAIEFIQKDPLSALAQLSAEEVELEPKPSDELANDQV